MKPALGLLAAALIAFAVNAGTQSRSDASASLVSTNLHLPSSVPSEPVLLDEASSEELVHRRPVAELVARLPDRFRDIVVRDWVNLECELLTNPDALLPGLIERYGREQTPAYKGLLGVLLSA